jgi:hypothetical protein
MITCKETLDELKARGYITFGIAILSEGKICELSDGDIVQLNRNGLLRDEAVRIIEIPEQEIVVIEAPIGDFPFWATKNSFYFLKTQFKLIQQAAFGVFKA